MEEYRFKADDWNRRTTSEQIYRCRLLAQQAHALSGALPLEVRRAYLDLANAFTKLAVALEGTLKGDPL